MITLSSKFYSIIASKITKVSVAVLTFLAPVGFVFILIGFAIVLDTFAGRWAAKKIALRNGNDVRLTVTSKKTREGLVSKMITYQLAILSLYVIDYFVINKLISYYFPTFPIQYITTIFVGIILVWIEWDSIDEKYYLVTGKRINDLIKKRFKKSKTMIKGLAQFKEEMTEKINNDEK